ncbi:MAG: hypothetical protein AAB250_02665 [Bdellovibrionota bacterium]
MKALTLTAALFVSFLGSIALASDPSQGKVEKILGYQPSSKGLVFQVSSGGCTRRDDFTAKIVRNETGIVQLVLIRVRPDLCYPFLPMGERLGFTYEQLGFNPGERFTVLNPNGVVHGWIWEQQDK